MAYTRPPGLGNIVLVQVTRALMHEFAAPDLPEFTDCRFASGVTLPPITTDAIGRPSGLMDACPTGPNRMSEKARQEDI